MPTTKPLTVAERYAAFRASIEPQLAKVRPAFDMDSMPSSAARVRGHNQHAMRKGNQPDRSKPTSRVGTGRKTSGGNIYE